MHTATNVLLESLAEKFTAHLNETNGIPWDAQTGT